MVHVLYYSNHYLRVLNTKTTCHLIKHEKIFSLECLRHRWNKSLARKIFLLKIEPLWIIKVEFYCAKTKKFAFANVYIWVTCFIFCFFPLRICLNNVQSAKQRKLNYSFSQTNARLPAAKFLLFLVLSNTKRSTRYVIRSLANPWDVIWHNLMLILMHILCKSSKEKIMHNAIREMQ